MHESQEQPRLQMHGGIRGGLVPMVVLAGVLVWLSVEGVGGTKTFWAAGWLAIVAGLFLARDKTAYCGSVMRGLGDRSGIVIVTAWLFAGVFGKLMVAGGLVDGLLWFGLASGAQGAAFTLIAFVAAMLFSLGTGTSTGTVLSLVPVLYPAGVFLGANPAMLALGVLSGAAFGDNLAPVSDTTIVSAYTQGATMKDVVKSRFPLAMTAAAIAAVVFLVAGSGGEKVTSLPEMETQMNPAGLLMLVSFAVVVVSALCGRHIIESLIYGNVSAVILGLINRQLALSDVFHIPALRGESTGIIQDGIEGVIGAIVFALLILAVTQVLVDSGVMNGILKLAERGFLKTVRQAELTIIFITILVSIPISANAPAELLVGPSLVKPIGRKFKLAPARRANLMDCAVCTVFYTLPWHIAVVVWYSAVVSAAQPFGMESPSVSVAALNPYSWSLLAVILFSAVTGWNRKFATEDESSVGQRLPNRV